MLSSEAKRYSSEVKLLDKPMERYFDNYGRLSKPSSISNIQVSGSDKTTINDLEVRNASQQPPESKSLCSVMFLSFPSLN
jgi:hypothetical protein